MFCKTLVRSRRGHRTCRELALDDEKKQLAVVQDEPETSRTNEPFTPELGKLETRGTGT
jgi:hypothetical protein